MTAEEAMKQMRAKIDSGDLTLVDVAEQLIRVIKTQDGFTGLVNENNAVVSKQLEKFSDAFKSVLALWVVGDASEADKSLEYPGTPEERESFVKELFTWTEPKPQVNALLFDPKKCVCGEIYSVEFPPSVIEGTGHLFVNWACTSCGRKEDMKKEEFELLEKGNQNG